MLDSNISGVVRERMKVAIRQSQAGEKGVVYMTEYDNLPHHVIAELLHEFAYQNRQKPQKSAEIVFRYTGRQESMPVPLYCLSTAQDRHAEVVPFTEIPLRVGLISMRHLPLDHMVDISWLLNQEIPHNEAYGKKDEYFYKQSLKQLEQFTKKGIRRIHLYQTGYHAAVIGFYRSLIEFLKEQQTRRPTYCVLEVTPYYYDLMQRCYWRGSTWS